ncbi:MAG: TonB-dependent receptor, partial [Deltaproteobacteria bacterium]|nr:TonB-dependent receptor [Deltaproteobacteria bacterium]
MLSSFLIPKLDGKGGAVMRIMKAIIAVFVLIVFAVINVDLAFSQDDQDLEKMAIDKELEQSASKELDAIDEEIRYLKAEMYVITPSRIPEKIKKTASSITVVTDRQIRQMGARDLADVLERAVPGIVGSKMGNPGAFDIAIRGQANANSSNILIMINSHPINEVGSGGATWAHDTLIVDNIKRIEVLRSPGSAVYGANAFVGVINIITKEAEDIDGFELIARGGSWDTQQYNLLYGKTFSDLEVAFNLNYFKTHGFRGLVEEDFQTQLDRLVAPFGFPTASLAPGRMAGDREKYDVALNLKYKGFEFDGRYVDKEWDLPIGWATAL